MDLASSYFNLARKIVTAPIQNKKEVLGALLTSLSYMTAEVWEQQVNQAEQQRSGSNARVTQIFERFIALVCDGFVPSLRPL